MTGNERFTQQARRVLSIAYQEAVKHVDLIGPEHLLFGLLEVSDGMAARILREIGIKPDRIHQLISQMTGEESSGDPNRIELSSESQLALANAIEEGRRLGTRQIDTEHILLGLINFDNYAVEILRRDGITPDHIRQQAAKTLFK